MTLAARKAAAILVATAMIASSFGAIVPTVSASPAIHCTDTQTLNIDTHTCVDNPVVPPVVITPTCDDNQTLIDNVCVDNDHSGHHDGNHEGDNHDHGDNGDNNHGHDGDHHHGHDGNDGDDNGDGSTPPPFVPQTGGLSVVKVVVGGSATPDQFSFSFDGVSSTTFNISGENDFFIMATGTYSVTETATTTYTANYSGCSGTIAANATSTCTITNTYIAPVVVTPPADTGTGGGSGDNNTPAPAVTSNGGGGGGGVVIGGPLGIGFVNTNAGGGLVLGTSTEASSDTSAACSTPLLTTFMREGKHNDKGEVTKLQNFLNTQLGLTIPVTGFFGSQTTAGVNTFQAKYQNDILSPWTPFGFDGHTPTGYVYKTTQHQINKLACSSLNLPAPQLP